MRFRERRTRSDDRTADPEALVEALVAAGPGSRRAATTSGSFERPGRVNLIGEHTDYNDGFVLPVAIDLEIQIAVHADRRSTGRAPRDSTSTNRTASTSTPPRPKASTWLDYVVGTAWALEEAGLPLTGLRGVIASTLPANAGLSSSAAIELASAWAMLGDAATAIDRVPSRQALPASRERLRRRPERPHGPVRRVMWSGRIGAVPRLPVRRLAADPAARRPRDRRLPHGLTASPRRVRVQPAPKPVRGRGGRDPASSTRVESLRDVTPDLLAAAADRAVGRRVRPRASTSSPRTGGSARPSPRSRPATSTRSAGCSPRAMPRSATGSRSARRSSTRWSRSPRRCLASSPRG